MSPFDWNELIFFFFHFFVCDAEIELIHDFQVIVKAATKNLRPTIPAKCPEAVANVIRVSVLNCDFFLKFLVQVCVFVMVFSDLFLLL